IKQKGNNMADSINIDFHSKSIFQGTSTMIIATYTGDSAYTVTEKNIIECKSTNQNVVVSVYGKQNVDVTSKTITATFEIYVKTSTDKSDIVLEFKTDIVGSQAKIDPNYKQLRVEDIQPWTFVPLISGSYFLEDFSPAEKKPEPDNPFLEMQLSPRDIGNITLPYCQITLDLDEINYARLFDKKGNEISPYNDNKYYLNADSNGDIDVKFYAKNLPGGYAKIINLSTSLGNSIFAGSAMLFITKDILPTDGIHPPKITNLVSGKLTPPRKNDGEDDSVFHIEVPEYVNAKPTDHIFIMNNNKDGDVVCTSGSYGSELEAPYDSITQLGYNQLYYYVNSAGVTYKSGSLYFYLAGSKPNKPPFNGILDKVSVLDGTRNPIGENDYINVENIADGLICEVPVGELNQPQLGDYITVNVKINGYDSITSKPRQPFNMNLITKQKIKSNDITNHKVEIPIGRGFLDGYAENSEGDAGHIYIIYYVTNKNESSKVWMRRIDTVLLGGSN
ncbi:hypothetical protein J8V57_19405, partial [Xenorhabdus sp. PB61.4]|uniref:hypothetical protein n=1 Tax=Xenorhabdus sp. PB61.4 TaxID=2788940 RepID=UPI001E581729